MEIIFENEDFVAVNKASGVLSIPDRKQSEPSLKDLLLQKYPSIYTVHRLDKATSGLIIFAKNAETHKLLSEKFRNREIEKIYLGLVYGNLQPTAGNIEAAIEPHPTKKDKMRVHKNGKPSLTMYDTIEFFKNYSLVRYNIFTGRTHQIRVHTAYLGSFIVCDDMYGDGRPVFISQIKKNYKLSKNEVEERPILNRLALHAHTISFTLRNNQYTLQAPMPKDMSALLKQLRKNNSTVTKGNS